MSLGNPSGSSLGPDLTLVDGDRRSARSRRPSPPADARQPGRAADANVPDLESEVERLRRALSTRTQIGIAIGLLAARHGCTASQAWAYLVRVSSEAEAEVAEIARVLVAAVDGTLDRQDTALLDRLGDHLPERAGRMAGGARGTPGR